MSDRDPSARDELLAAYLDGEATAAERDLIRNDPELLARARTLAHIAALVAEPVTAPDPHTRETHITNALAASTTKPNITAITQPTKHRRPHTLRIATIAAAIAALAIATPLLLNQTDNNDNDLDAIGARERTGLEAADSADEAEAPALAEAGDAAAETAVDPQSAPTSETVTEMEADIATGAAEESAGGELGFDEPSDLLGSRLDLGPVGDLDALAAAIGEPDTAGGPTGSPGTETSGPDLSCPALVDEFVSADGNGVQIVRGTVVYAGTPAEYIVIPGTPPAIVVVAVDDCRELARS